MNRWTRGSKGRYNHNNSHSVRATQTCRLHVTCTHLVTSHGLLHMLEDEASHVQELVLRMLEDTSIDAQRGKAKATSARRKRGVEGASENIGSCGGL